MLTTDMTSKYEIQVADPRTLSRHPTKLSYLFTSLLTDKTSAEISGSLFLMYEVLEADLSPTCTMTSVLYS